MTLSRWKRGLLFLGLGGCLFFGALPTKSQAPACNGSISGTVRDVSGQPLPGWTVQLLDGQGNPVNPPVVTGGGGGYAFPGLPCGNYTVAVVIPPGSTLVVPGDGFRQVFIQPASQVQANVDFVSRPEACPAGDLVDIFNSGFNESASQRLPLVPSTVDDDWLLMENLATGLRQRACWDGQGLVIPNRSQLVLSPPLQVSTRCYSPNGQCVWADVGAQSEWVAAWPANPAAPAGLHFYQHCFCLAEGFSEPGLSFSLLADNAASVWLNGTEVYSTPTTSAFLRPGGFPDRNNPADQFLVDPATLLRPGINCLTVAVCNLVGPVFPSSPTGFEIQGSVLARNGQCCVQPGRICGTKWKDLNGDGQRQPGEPGVGGWDIQLRNAFDVILETRRTAPDGSYCFERDSGTYAVTEAAPASGRWIPTAPALPYSIRLSPGERVNGLDFGNLPCPDADEPGVSYAATDPRDPVCRERIVCAPFQTVFRTACGCGCAPRACEPDLRIFKDFRPHGLVSYYGIDIQNVGSCPAPAPIVLTDVLPPGLRLDGLEGLWSGWTCQKDPGAGGPEKVTCTYGGPPLQPGETTGGFLRIKPPTDEGVQNCASVSAEGDRNPANDVACTQDCADAGESRNVCPRGPLPRERIGSPARAGCTYRWSPAQGLSDPTLARPTVQFPLPWPEGSATYTVDVECADGCRGTDSITLTQRVVPGLLENGVSRVCGLQHTFTLAGWTGSSLVWECARRPGGPWSPCPGAGNGPVYTASTGLFRRRWVRVRVACGPSEGYSNTVMLSPFC